MGRTVAAVFSAAVASAAIAAPANAGIITSSARSCDGSTVSKPFSRFGDNASYKPLTGGSFEGSMTGWTLSGGAKVVAGNESYNVAGAGQAKSLSLPAGSSAVSPATCVGLAEPTLRLFAKRNSALLGLVSTLQVQMQVQTSVGLSVWLPVLPGDVGGASWHPTAAMPLIANLLTLSATDQTPVRFRFTPLLGSWQVDDVYVDPMRLR